MSNWTVQHRGPVAVLNYSRPPDHYMSAQALSELGDIVTECADDTDRIKVIVLTGAEEGSFINHGDIPELLSIDSDGKVPPSNFQGWFDVFAKLEDVPQPTVAAINGLASGAGSEIALACTLRVGSPRAQLQQSEILAGVIPGGGAAARLPRLVGPAVAAEAIFTGKVYDAEEALRVGWLNAILPEQDFLDNVLQWTDSMTQRSGAALIAAKMALKQSARLPFNDAVEREREFFLDHLSALLTGGS